MRSVREAEGQGKGQQSYEELVSKTREDPSGEERIIESAKSATADRWSGDRSPSVAADNWRGRIDNIRRIRAYAVSTIFIVDDSESDTITTSRGKYI